MEKKRSKGSFFSLFDWNAKSRKKLVWNNPTSQPGNVNHFVMSLFNVLFLLLYSLLAMFT
jgi:hypothetical protein